MKKINSTKINSETENKTLKKDTDNKLPEDWMEFELGDGCGFMVVARLTMAP